MTFKITIWNGETYIIEAKNIYQLISIADKRFRQDYEIQDLTVSSQCARIEDINLT